MRMVILGGTFNPIHLGHLYLADEARLSLGFDKVIFVPDNIPAHKEVGSSVTARSRLDMLETALASTRDFLMDTCEIDRGGVSYAIETVDELSKRYDLADKAGFILGDDLVAGFPRWKEAQRLSDSVELIVAHRNYSQRVQFAYPHTYLDNTMLPISSSEIRRRVREKGAYRFWVPDPVFEYIRKNGLYR